VPIIGVIPARGGSQRLPGKNIRPILGKPLVAYTIEAALEASTLARVIVSTDDDEIARISRDFGAEVVMRPKELASATAPIDDALRHVVDFLRENEGLSIEAVVSMQANNPVRKGGEIDDVVRRLIATPWATAVATAYKLSERPEWAKIVIDEQTMEIRPFMDAGTMYRMQDLRRLYLLDGATIAVPTEVLQKAAGDGRVHVYLGERIVIEVHDPMYAVEIDELEDVQLAEFYLARWPRTIAQRLHGGSAPLTPARS